MLHTQNRGDIGNADNPTFCSRQVHEATLLVCHDSLQNSAQRFGRYVNVVLMQLLGEQSGTLGTIPLRSGGCGNGLHSRNAAVRPNEKEMSDPAL
jgi:hypothetical protein